MKLPPILTNVLAGQQTQSGKTSLEFVNSEVVPLTDMISVERDSFAAYYIGTHVFLGFLGLRRSAWLIAPMIALVRPAMFGLGSVSN